MNFDERVLATGRVTQEQLNGLGPCVIIYEPEYYDAAILGVSTRDGNNVLVYDYDGMCRALHLVDEENPTTLSLHLERECECEDYTPKVFMRVQDDDFTVCEEQLIEYLGVKGVWVELS